MTAVRFVSGFSHHVPLRLALRSKRFADKMIHSVQAYAIHLLYMASVYDELTVSVYDASRVRVVYDEPTVCLFDYQGESVYKCVHQVVAVTQRHVIKPGSIPIGLILS